jgi:hypothetical protein
MKRVAASRVGCDRAAAAAAVGAHHLQLGAAVKQRIEKRTLTKTFSVVNDRIAAS